MIFKNIIFMHIIINHQAIILYSIKNIGTKDPIAGTRNKMDNHFTLEQAPTMLNRIKNAIVTIINEIDAAFATRRRLLIMLPIKKGCKKSN